MSLADIVQEALDVRSRPRNPEPRAGGRSRADRSRPRQAAAADRPGSEGANHRRRPRQRRPRRDHAALVHGRRRSRADRLRREYLGRAHHPEARLCRTDPAVRERQARAGRASCQRRPRVRSRARTRQAATEKQKDHPDQYRHLARRIAAGWSSETDVLRWESQLASNDRDIANAKASVLVNLFALNSVRALPREAPVTVRSVTVEEYGFVYANEPIASALAQPWKRIAGCATAWSARNCCVRRP